MQASSSGQRPKEGHIPIWPTISKPNQLVHRKWDKVRRYAYLSREDSRDPRERIGKLPDLNVYQIERYTYDHSGAALTVTPTQFLTFKHPVTIVV